MNTLQAPVKQKPKQKQNIDLSLETLRNSISNDLIKPISTDVASQVFGFETGNGSATKSGDLQPGVELDMRALEQKKKEHAVAAEPGIAYHREIVHAEKKIHAENQQEINVKVQEIVIELKKLTESSKELEAQFKGVAAVTRVVKPGKYHVNFFEWVLAAIRQARAKVEDSSHWMQAMGRKNGKKGYWGMFKQHGTSFAMSNERAIATQAG